MGGYLVTIGEGQHCLPRNRRGVKNNEALPHTSNYKVVLKINKDFVEDTMKLL